MEYVACQFTTSLLLGDREKALFASAALQNLNDNVAIDRFVRMTAASRNKGVARPTEEGEAFWLDMQDRLSGEARRICNVFW